MSNDFVVGVVSIHGNPTVKVLHGEYAGKVVKLSLGNGARMNGLAFQERLSRCGTGGILIVEQSIITGNEISCCYLTVLKSAGANKRVLISGLMGFSLLTTGASQKKILSLDDYRAARWRNESFTAYVSVFKKVVVDCYSLRDIVDQLFLIAETTTSVSFTPTIATLSGDCSVVLQRSTDGGFDFKKTLSSLENNERLIESIGKDTRCILGVSLRMSNLSLTSFLSKIEQGKAGRESTALKRLFSHTQRDDGLLILGEGVLISDIKPNYEYSQNFIYLNKFLPVYDAVANQ